MDHRLVRKKIFFNKPLSLSLCQLRVPINPPSDKLRPRCTAILPPHSKPPIAQFPRIRERDCSSGNGVCVCVQEIRGRRRWRRGLTQVTESRNLSSRCRTRKRSPSKRSFVRVLLVFRSRRALDVAPSPPFPSFLLPASRWTSKIGSL